MRVASSLVLGILLCGLIGVSSMSYARGSGDNNIKSAVFHKQKLTDQEKKDFKIYKKCTNDVSIMMALQSMKGSMADFARRAILGENLTKKPVKVAFKNLGELNPKYANYDALGWKIRGQLYIYINEKHKGAPPEALASLLSHEAMHQDSFNSINEETYAWTLEAAVWTDYVKKSPELQKQTMFPLVRRLNTLNNLFIKANYTNKYIRKIVKSNRGYQDLPPRSPGFENVK